MPSPYIIDGDQAASIAAVAYLAELSPVQVKGYVVVTITDDDRVLIATNRCCMLHSADDLATAIACVVRTEMCGPDAIT